MGHFTTPATAAVAVALQTIATNLANVNTADYRAGRIDFEDALRDALRTGAAEPDAALRKIAELRDTVQDGALMHFAKRAGVELDIELTHMSDTVLRYHALIQGLAKHGSLARMAITGEAKG
jgi:flagellar basal-body rod protein FlgB